MTRAITRCHPLLDGSALPGAATATVGHGPLVFGLSGAADHGWTTALTLGPILAGLLALATFVGLEARSKQPPMPLWVFRDRNRGGAYLIQALLGAALFGMFFLSTLFCSTSWATPRSRPEPPSSP